MLVIKLRGYEWEQVLLFGISQGLRDKLSNWNYNGVDFGAYRNREHYWNLYPRDVLSGQQLYELFDACAAMKIEPLVSWV